MGTQTCRMEQALGTGRVGLTWKEKCDRPRQTDRDYFRPEQKLSRGGVRQNMTSLVSFSLEHFPKDPSVLAKAAFPWGCLVQPFPEPPDFSKPCPTLSSIPHCQKCLGLANPSLAFPGNHKFMCPFCHQETPLPPQYSTADQRAGALELNSPVLDCLIPAPPPLASPEKEAPRPGTPAPAAATQPVTLFAVDCGFAPEWLEPLKLALTQTISGAPPLDWPGLLAGASALPSLLQALHPPTSIPSARKPAIRFLVGSHPSALDSLVPLSALIATQPGERAMLRVVEALGSLRTAGPPDLSLARLYLGVWMVDLRVFPPLHALCIWFGHKPRFRPPHTHTACQVLAGAFTPLSASHLVSLNRHHRPSSRPAPVRAARVVMVLATPPQRLGWQAEANSLTAAALCCDLVVLGPTWLQPLMSGLGPAAGAGATATTGPAPSGDDVDPLADSGGRDPSALGAVRVLAQWTGGLVQHFPSPAALPSLAPTLLGELTLPAMRRCLIRVRTSPQWHAEPLGLRYSGLHRHPSGEPGLYTAVLLRPTQCLPLQFAFEFRARGFQAYPLQAPRPAMQILVEYTPVNMTLAAPAGLRAARLLTATAAGLAADPVGLLQAARLDAALGLWAWRREPSEPATRLLAQDIAALIARYHEAINEKDWDGRTALLSYDFAFAEAPGLAALVPAIHCALHHPLMTASPEAYQAGAPPALWRSWLRYLDAPTILRTLRPALSGWISADTCSSDQMPLSMMSVLCGGHLYYLLDGGLERLLYRPALSAPGIEESPIWPPSPASLLCDPTWVISSCRHPRTGEAELFESRLLEDIPPVLAFLRGEVVKRPGESDGAGLCSFKASLTESIKKEIRLG
ncbi:hypothetical protein PAPYR_10140 [Paratrimastix pyriformis]|uniref:Zinc finger Sec23/Sec24-type domain-containing protein n=1 Tax=Paratrimastix pyriformis TaxID=342808 RepID=A0ABQ8UBK7_9EUKA|nr:hypothetical protein PAPYR_10140 [Paratrimastix pyriformis]